jgi:hypothetical protein
MYLCPSFEQTSASRDWWKMARGRAAGQPSKTAFVPPQKRSDACHLDCWSLRQWCELRAYRFKKGRDRGAPGPLLGLGFICLFACDFG